MNSNETNDPHSLPSSLDFEVQRAYAEKGTRPDARMAFEAFQRRNIPSLHATRHRPAVKWAAVALTAVAASLLWFLVFSPKAPQPLRPQPQQVPGNRVYAAVSAPQHVSIATRGEELTLSSPQAKQEGFTLLPGNVIALNSTTESDGDQLVTLSIPQGKVAQLQLSDGTRVWIGAGSKLNFPKTFAPQGTREVALTGEAYFEVMPDTRRPFVVTTDNISTTVLGTRFNVRSFAGEMPIVTLVEGSVRVSTKERETILKPGKQVLLTTSGNLLTRTADLEAALAWQQGMFFFDGQTLRDIMTEVGRWYNTDVVFASNRHLNDSLHFNAERSLPLEVIIEQLNAISQTHIHLVKNSIVVE